MFAVTYTGSGDAYTTGRGADNKGCDQLFANDDIFRYDLNLYKSGKTRVPCRIKRLGMELRERRSAETLWVAGVCRTDSFSMNLYLRRSMANTRTHKGIWGATTR